MLIPTCTCMSAVLSMDANLLPIQEALWETRSQWRDIGLELGLKQKEIEAINEPSDGQCLHKVLLCLIQSGRATTNHLLKALNSERVNRPDTAKKMSSLRGAARLAIGLNDEISEQLENAVREGKLEEVKRILHNDVHGILTRGMMLLHGLNVLALLHQYN